MKEIIEHSYQKVGDIWTERDHAILVKSIADERLRRERAAEEAVKP